MSAIVGREIEEEEGQRESPRGSFFSAAMSQAAALSGMVDTALTVSLQPCAVRAASGTVPGPSNDRPAFRIAGLFPPHPASPLFTMASDGPDPQTLKNWQDVFQYPIPTVRRVEQELRRDIASNKEKLRALVG